MLNCFDSCCLMLICFVSSCQGVSKAGSILDIWVPVELQCICEGSLKGNGSLLNAWAEMRRKLSSHSAQVWCRWDISLVYNPPIGTSFGPQNIHSHYGPRMHHWNAFLFRFPETLFPKVVRIATQLCH